MAVGHIPYVDGDISAANRVMADWLNDLNRLCYVIFDDPADVAAARTAIGLGTGNSPTFTGATFSGLTASSLVATDANKALTSSVSGLSPTFTGLTLTGTLAVTGNTTLTGDLAVNGGDLTTSATTFNLLNATATTINFGGGASTALNIGHASGTNTILGASTFSQLLTASVGVVAGTGSTILGLKQAYLTAGVTISSQTTPQTLSDLTLAIGAGETWLFEAVIFFTSNLEQTGLRFVVNTPSGATQDILVTFGMNRFEVLGGGTYTDPSQNSNSTTSGHVFEVTAAQIVQGSNCIVRCAVRVTTTDAGNVTWQFAQETSSGTGLNAERGGMVRAVRVA